MKKLTKCGGLAVAVVLSVIQTWAEEEGSALRCTKSASFLAPTGASVQRQYAPDLEVQMQHLILDITPDFKQRAIRAKASLRFKPAVRPVREVCLDAVDLTIESVTATEKIQAWQATDSHIIVTFETPIPADKPVTVTINYSAEPLRGLYFRTPEMGYREGDAHLFTQGESVEARCWYPCLDSPNQLFTSEVICHVPDGMTSISNGRLVSGKKDAATGLVAMHWSQEKPHASYLISLVVGYFKELQDNYRDIPLAFYTPPSESQYASNSFRETREMMKFFEAEIGVPYPWAKYDQVCVNDFVAGGMENTSATTLTDSTLFSPETENLRDSEGLVSHELAHQWFGDLVTCKDWSQVWLNEGFATYYESLWNAHHHGREAMLYELYQRARHITGIQNDDTPIVRRTFDQPDQMFGYLVYPKASWVLHMLRSQLGDDLFRHCIKTYLERHQHGNVVTDDLRAVLEEQSGRSLDQFFDQWLYHGHHPELEVQYQWDEPSKLAKLSIQQVQELNANVLLFNFPLTIGFKGKFGAVKRDIQVSRKQEDFYFALESAPEIVRIDPEYTLLARIKFKPSTPMLYAQLNDKDDVIGRLLAIEQLSGRQDQQSVARLQQVLRGDSFYGARIEASKALRACHSQDALAALIACAKQTDARVRLQVVDDVGAFYSETAQEFGRQVLDTEANPEILGSALRDLSGYAKPELSGLLVKWLNSDSFRNELADAAVNAMRSQDDPKSIGPLTEVLLRREREFTTRGLAQGIGAVAYLARNEENKDSAREFLAGYLSSKKRRVELAAINALGTLGDPKAIALLEKYASAAKSSPEQGAAERAISNLRAGRKPVDDFKNLRQEVLDLQKSNRDLRREFDDFKKKVEAERPASASTPTSPARKPKTKSPKQK